jgi:phage terminase small subunit
MTPKQERFVEEYLVDLNATAAAKRAGYSEATAHTTGHENINKPEIAEAIAAEKARRSERTAISADRVLKEYARIGFASLKDFTRVTADGEPGVDLSNLSDDDWAALSEVTSERRATGSADGEAQPDIIKTKIKLADKLSALKALSNHLGMDAPTKLAMTDTEGNDVAPTSPDDLARAIAFWFAKTEAEKS